MHAQKDVNVTPPNKKRKKEKSDEEEKNQAMEEDITEDITNQIKKCVINDKEVEMEELKELSNKQDEKVKMKQRAVQSDYHAVGFSSVISGFLCLAYFR